MAKANRIEDTCQYKRCKKDSDLIYTGVGLCFAHWVVLCKMNESPPHHPLRKLTHHYIRRRAKKVLREHYNDHKKEVDLRAAHIACRVNSVPRS